MNETLAGVPPDVVVPEVVGVGVVPPFATGHDYPLRTDVPFPHDMKHPLIPVADNYFPPGHGVKLIVILY